MNLPRASHPVYIYCNFCSIPRVSYRWDTTSSPTTNPLIDRVLGSNFFPITNKENPVSDSRPSMRTTISEEMSRNQFPTTPTPTSGKIIQLQTFQKTMTATLKIDVSLVNNVAHLRICELLGTQQFTLKSQGHLRSYYFYLRLHSG